jgi:hypothetical protein
MTNEPVLSIGAVFTSLKAAVIAVLTVVALQLNMDANSTAAVIGAGAAITLAVGDIFGYYLTRQQVTPIASPNLPIGTTVNADSPNPTGVVVEN